MILLVLCSEDIPFDSMKNEHSNPQIFCYGENRKSALDNARNKRFSLRSFCDSCRSELYWKNGFRKDGTTIQRYVCRDCGTRFSEQIIKITHVTSRGRQICVTLTEGTKNLTEVETKAKNWLEGATKNSDAELKSLLFEYSWSLHRDGYAVSTNKTYTYLLRSFAKKGANLNDPESVKTVIAQQNWSNGRKQNAVKAYDKYAKMHDIEWKRPIYKAVDKAPFIPTEQEIDSLISGCSHQMATFLQVLKETGARRGEAFNLTWEDIDFVTKVIRITPEKGSNARTFRMSEKLIQMLKNLAQTKKRVWTYKNTFYLGKGLVKMRKRTAHKIGNPRLNRITFHTLRYWRATLAYEYSKGDLTYVQEILGHKNIENTRRYTRHCRNQHGDERFIVKIARNAKEACALLENGYDYVTGEYSDGGKLFRKQKRSFLGSWSTKTGSWSSMD